MTTIFIAGFHHETNTFAPSPADWAAFTCGAGYPAYARGDAMLAQMAPTAQAIGGFIAEALEHGWTLKPSVWAGAMPSNRVTADAFERICAEIVEDLRAGGFDAVFLDLHGAGVAECADDAEGELLARVRAGLRIVLLTQDLRRSAREMTRMEQELKRVKLDFLRRGIPWPEEPETGEKAA